MRSSEILSPREFWRGRADMNKRFEIGELLAERGYFDKAVYHFLQSIEKAVKAILLCFGEFKKTHFVGSFLKEK